LYSSLQYSFCCYLLTRPRGQHLSTFPWAHRSIKITKIPIIYPANSTTKIGVTVTMLTSIVDGCSLCSFEAMFCLKNLSWIPLSRICVKLWRNLYYIKCLIHSYIKSIDTKHYSYGCIKLNEKASVNKQCILQYHCTVPEGNVTYCKENSVLRLDVRQRVWTEHSWTWIMLISLEFTVYLSY